MDSMLNVSLHQRDQHVLVAREHLEIHSLEEVVYQRHALQPTPVQDHSPVSQANVEKDVMPLPVVLMLLVIQTPTNVSVKKDLWVMATSYACLPFCQPSVAQDVAPTVTVSTTFLTNVNVIQALVAIHMKDVLHPLLWM